VCLSYDVLQVAYAFVYHTVCVRSSVLAYAVTCLRVCLLINACCEHFVRSLRLFATINRLILVCREVKRGFRVMALHSLSGLTLCDLCHLSTNIAVARPPTSPSLSISDRSFRSASSFVWNQLSVSLCPTHPSLSVSHSPLSAPVTSYFSVDSPLSSFIIVTSHSLFHPRFKLHMFHKSSFSPWTLISHGTASTDYHPDRILVHGEVTIIFVVSVCLFVCAEFFSAVFNPISIKLGHMLYVWV